MSNKNNNKDDSTGPQGTQVFKLDDVNKMIADEITQAQRDGASTPALIGVSQNINGQRFVLDKDKLDVGRSPNSDIVLNVSSVSALHAQIINRDGHWKVLNLLSSNGTFVNGEKISEKIIVPGDRVAFAGAECVFSMIDEPKEKKSSDSNMTPILVGAALVVAFAGLFFVIL